MLGEADVRNISIHTPARGVTAAVTPDGVFKLISIHTPARGVTFYFAAIFSPSIISIHTPARGVTVYKAALNLQILFQSTLPQGE